MRFTVFVLTLLLLLLHTGPGAAQETTGNIEGFLTNENGEPVTYANVVVSGLSLPGTRGGISGNTGYFLVPNLPPGKYTVIISHIAHEGLTFEEGVERITNGNAHMTGDYWKVKYKKKAIEKFTPKMIRDFYNDPYVGYLYLIELLHWNFTPTFNNFRRNLMGLRNGKVLEIGAGIGTVAIQLAIQLNEVVASETNKYLKEFIAYRWQGMLGEIESKHGELFLVDQEWRETAEDEQFGAVVAIDVFEHLPEDYLKEMIGDIRRVLPIGGSLIYHANFGQQDLYPQHYNYEEWWVPFLQEQGFVHTGPFEAVKVR